jgi:hypothetical protein
MSPVAAEVASGDSAPTPDVEPLVVVVAGGALPELELELLEDPQAAASDASAADAASIEIARCTSGMLGIRSENVLNAGRRCSERS